jgi:hypothetical protein
MSLQEVMTNLNREIKKIEGATLEGLVAAGQFVKAESVDITPAEFGNLRNSAGSKPIGPLSVAVYYTQSYAPYVHEMPEHNNYTTPGTGPKFLERAVKENVPTILQIIANRAKI